MSASLPRLAPTPVPIVHAPAPAPQGTPTAPDRVPERAGPGRPFADLLRQRRTESSPPASASPPKPTAVQQASPGTVGPPGTEVDGEAETAASGPEKHVATARARARLAQLGKAAADVGKGTHQAPAADAGAEEDATQASTDRPPSAAEPSTPRPLPLLDDTAGGPAARFARVGADPEAVDAHRADADDTDAVAASAALDSPSRRYAGRSARSDTRSGRGESPRPTEAPEPARIATATLDTERAPPAEASAGRASFDLRLATAPLVPTAAMPAAPAEPLPAGTPVPTLALPTPLDSPQFAGALGAQVSVLVKDGVHAAELHLNPAEMGPVSIRIRLDGSDAQVQFGADLAETRQAIESGLPELASALRDAGFTLSGGGVSPHAGHGHDHGGSDGAAASMPPPTSLEAQAQAPRGEAARAVRHVAAGGVDVYA